MLSKWITAKKDELIGLRVSKEFKAFLKKKADDKGVSLTELIENNLFDSYKSDKELIADLIARRKKERPEYWEALNKSPIVREFEEHLATLFTELVNPLKKTDYKYQPVVLLVWFRHFLEETIKHFGSIPEEHKRVAAHHFIAIGEALIEAFPMIKAKDNEIQMEIIKEKIELAEKACYQITAMAFAKDSFTRIKTELEKVQAELLKELK